MMTGDDIIIHLWEGKHLVSSITTDWECCVLPASQIWKCFSAEIIFPISVFLSLVLFLYHFPSRGFNITGLKHEHYSQSCCFIFKCTDTALSGSEMYTWATSHERRIAILPLYLHLVVSACWEFHHTFFFMIVKLSLNNFNTSVSLLYAL